MIITACLLIGAGAASADTACMSSTAPGSPGSISAYGDAQGTSCYAFDGGGLVTVFLWHTNTDGATASQFLLDVAAAGWTWLGDNWNFTTVIGQSTTGVSVAYGACLTSPISLGTINFFGNSAPTCTRIGIVPDPATLTGEIEAVDCDETKFFPTGGMMYVNPDITCTCNACPPPPPSPVEESTWGAIKSMYR
jgi:hypothetical protein